MLAIVIGLLLTVVVALGILALVALPNLRQGSRILTPDGQRAVKRARQQAKQKPLAAVGGTWHGLVAVERLLARMSRQIARFWAPIGAALHDALDRLEDRDAVTSTENILDAESGTPDLGKTQPVSREPEPGSEPVSTSTEPTSKPAPAQPATPIKSAPSKPAPIKSAPIKSAPSKPSKSAPTKSASSKSAPTQTRFDVSRIVGNSSVGHPRAVPPISGPIPEITDDQEGRTPTGTEQDGRTIDLRDGERSNADGGTSRGMSSGTGQESAREDGRKVDHEAGSARRGR